MKRWGFVAGIVLALAAGFLWWTHWKQDAPRRASLAALHRLQHALQWGSNEQLLESLALPPTLQSRTAAEQIEFVTKALRDEVSPEGLTELKRHAAFGSLKEIFPTEADGWARQAGVNPSDCLAFKLDRNGQRAEVVLAKPSTLNPAPSTGAAAYRVVRINNVKQLASNR